MVKVLLVLLCLVLPWLAVLIKDGPSMKVLWAFLLQLCGHVPGVVYGIYQVVQD
ncbi:YqaE/Pmp3 family membrane protein [Kitasatospora sp. NPDC127059]|uniref:YqaE/Pmp3 family membrane protein n=1 Tax=unclassified Kitasatospora TaxID=2633591 RepID=UPI00365E5DAA